MCFYHAYKLLKHDHTFNTKCWLKKKKKKKTFSSNITLQIPLVLFPLQFRAVLPSVLMGIF